MLKNDEFISFCTERKKHFTILRLTIQSLHAKFDQLYIILNKLKQHKFDLTLFVSEKPGGQMIRI